ncbi:MAG: HAMP domain-containing protein [Candidatus Nanoarchaeia archaeon]
MRKIERFGFRSVGTKLFLFFLVIAIIPMGIIAVMAYQQVQQDAKLVSATESLRFSGILLSECIDDNGNICDVDDFLNGYQVVNPLVAEYRTVEKHLVIADYEGNIIYTTHPEGYPKYVANMTSYLKAIGGSEGYSVEQYLRPELVTYTSSGYYTIFTHEDLKKTLAPAVDFMNKILGFSAIVLFIIIILSYLLSKALSRPIKNLIEASRNATKGNYKTELLPISSDDEIGLLQESFSNLMDSLQKKKKK